MHSVENLYKQISKQKKTRNAQQKIGNRNLGKFYMKNMLALILIEITEYS